MENDGKHKLGTLAARVRSVTHETDVQLSGLGHHPLFPLSYRIVL